MLDGTLFPSVSFRQSRNTMVGILLEWLFRSQVRYNCNVHRDSAYYVHFGDAKIDFALTQVRLFYRRTNVPLRHRMEPPAVDYFSTGARRILRIVRPVSRRSTAGRGRTGDRSASQHDYGPLNRLGCALLTLSGMEWIEVIIQ